MDNKVEITVSEYRDLIETKTRAILVADYVKSKVYLEKETILKMLREDEGDDF